MSVVISFSDTVIVEIYSFTVILEDLGTLWDTLEHIGTCSFKKIDAANYVPHMFIYETNFLKSQHNTTARVKTRF